MSAKPRQLLSLKRQNYTRTAYGGIQPYLGLGFPYNPAYKGGLASVFIFP